MNHWKRAAYCAILFLILVSPVLAQERTATITLGRDPEPPFCVLNPGGTVQIDWSITYQTTPRETRFYLKDPTQTLILDSQIYPGATGVNISRSWTVPSGSVDGKYWIRVEFYSFQADNEANAEVTFYVCTDVGSLCLWKYKDVNCNGVYDAGDTPVPDWWLCIHTPYNENYCFMTNLEGKVCFDGIPLGHYTVYEPLPIDPAWQPVGPTSYEIDLVSSEVVNVQFLNAKYDECFGACCLPSGLCVQVKPEDCALQLGAFQGLGTLCTGVVCPQPGACCDPDTGDCFLTLEVECPVGNIWHGEWTSCDPDNPCPVPPTGACCDPSTGDCTMTTQAECLDPMIWHGDWTTCEPLPYGQCPLPMGACCDPSTGNCTMTTQADCPDPMIWHGDWTTCEPLPYGQCPLPMGACCDPSTGFCTMTTQANCADPKIWHGDWTTCDPVPYGQCPPPVPTKDTTWGQIKSNYR